MNRSDLVQAIARRFPQLTAKDAEVGVTEILGAITATLGKGDRVEIRGFGTFESHVRAARIGRNPKTGAAVAVPEKRHPHFKAGKELRARVEASAPPPLPLKRAA